LARKSVDLRGGEANSVLCFFEENNFQLHEILQAERNQWLQEFIPNKKLSEHICHHNQ
jgi:hypothetical protein